MNCLY